MSKLRVVPLRLALASLLALCVLGCEEPIPDQASTGLDFLAGTPSFENFADDVAGWRLETAQAVELFGEAAVCVPGSSPCEPTANAQAWMDDVNATFTHGHSEGLALTTLAFQLGLRSPSDFGAESVAKLSKTNLALMREIARWGATQKIPRALERDRSFDAKDVMPFLAKAMKPGQPGPKEAWRLALVMKDGTTFRGGHALVPFGFFKGPKEGQFFIRVYDSNWPGQEQRIFIDRKANTWSYEGSAIPDAARSYVGTPENGNLLYLSPITAHVGPFEAPFADGSRSMVVAAEGAGVTLTDESGSQVGLGADGKVVEKGGVVRPAFAQSRCVLCPGPAEIVNYTLSPDGGMGGKQSISISDFGNTSADGGTVNVTAPGVTMKVTGVRTETSGATIEVQGKQVTYSSSKSNTPTSVTVTIAGADGGTTTVTVALNSAADGKVTVDASDPNNVKVTATNQSGGTVTGTVTVTSTSASGQTTTTSGAVDVKPGMPTTATVQPGASIAVSPPPNSSCNNSIWDPLRPDGTEPGAESDVDCGGVCPGCATSRLCRQDSDCASGVCLENAQACRPNTTTGCTWGLCQAPTCRDGVKNGAELDVDCGGPTCWRTCRQNMRCELSEQCALPLSGEAVCLGRPDGGAKTCGARKRYALNVRYDAPDLDVNLNGTVIDETRYDQWKVVGASNFYGTMSIPFDAARYHFQLGGQLPTPIQANFNCTLTNPTNDPLLLAMGGFGDGGQPSLQCNRTATSLIVRGRGCAGQSIPFTTTIGGTTRSYALPLAGSGEIGTGSMNLGVVDRSLSVDVPLSAASTTINGNAKVQTCSARSVLQYTQFESGPRSAGLYADINHCDCADAPTRGPTRTGNPCSFAEVVPAIAVGGSAVVNGTTWRGNNDFVFLPDSGCLANVDPRQSGADKAYRITVPPNSDLLARETVFRGLYGYLHTNIVGSLAECGTNGPTSADSGTAGARCTARGATYYANTTTSPKDVYFVIDGAYVGSQTDFSYTFSIVPHAATALGDPCSGAALAPTDGGVVRGTMSTANNIVFPRSEDAGCPLWNGPALSGPDVVYRFDLPAATRVSVQIADSCILAALVRAGSCGVTDSNASTQGTTGLTCAAQETPTFNCTKQLSYDNTSSSPETVYLVLEGTTAGIPANYAFTARTGPAAGADLLSRSGWSVQGNPCLSAQRRSGSLSYEDRLLSFRNDFYVPTSTTCSTTTMFGSSVVSDFEPSGRDTAIAYTVPAGHAFRVTTAATNTERLPPAFTTRLIVGESNCGTNGASFTTAGTQGLVCAASTSSTRADTVLAGQTLAYTNSTGSDQNVFVVMDTLIPVAGVHYFHVKATLTPPPDAGQPDAGPPDAGPPDAGPPDAGPPDAGPPDAGPPDAGPPDAGPPDAGPTDAGPPPCSTDSQCTSNNCYCATTPGNCLGMGRCVAGRAVISTTTDGGGASGTFTVPAGCTQVHVSAWGAAGGEAEEFFPTSTLMPGGAGGYVSGLLAVAPGDVFTAWIGRGGANSSGVVGGEGVGSYFGVAANGGAIEVGTTAGGGGGLTSVRQTGSVTRSFTVPAGGGAGLAFPAAPAGGAGAGTASTFSGGDADPGSEGGGGGAGENGGLGATAMRAAGAPGAFGTLPMGLTSQVGSFGVAQMPAPNPSGAGTPNYALCPSGTGRGNGGNGCVVLRCTTP